jgi:Lysozyme like domain
MADYTYSQLKQLWIQNGGKAAAADIAAAVALAESGGNPAASNSNTNGSTDRGLWQINSVHGNLSTFDVTGNVKAAIQISNNGANWSPWVTYVSGAYRKFLSPTTAASGSTGLPADTTAGIGIPGVGGISVSGVLTSAVNALLKMLGLGSLKDLVERMGLIILGFALVILGIHLLASGNGGSSKSQPVMVEEKSGTSPKTSKPVSEAKTTSKKTVAGTGATRAVEAAAVA